MVVVVGRLVDTERTDWDNPACAENTVAPFHLPSTHLLTILRHYHIGILLSHCRLCTDAVVLVHHTRTGVKAQPAHQMDIGSLKHFVPVETVHKNSFRALSARNALACVHTNVAVIAFASLTEPHSTNVLGAEGRGHALLLMPQVVVHDRPPFLLTFLSATLFATGSLTIRLAIVRVVACHM